LTHRAPDEDRVAGSERGIHRLMLVMGQNYFFADFGIGITA
jgi:hypothetical protein